MKSNKVCAARLVVIAPGVLRAPPQNLVAHENAHATASQHFTLRTAPGHPQSTTVEYQSTDNYYANL